jgi:hypothetical protein
MTTKQLGRIFLIFFGGLGLLIGLTWIKFIVNLQTDGGEIGDSAFFLIFLPVTIYYAVITSWTYRLYKVQSEFNTSTTIQYVLIFFFGICFSLWGLTLIF